MVQDNQRFIIEETYYNRYFDPTKRILFDGSMLSQMMVLWKNVVPMRKTKDTIEIALIDRETDQVIERFK